MKRDADGAIAAGGDAADFEIAVRAARRVLADALGLSRCATPLISDGVQTILRVSPVRRTGSPGGSDANATPQTVGALAHASA
jgi:hypothetical protein